jgi:hypothetical protein
MGFIKLLLNLFFRTILFLILEKKVRVCILLPLFYNPNEEGIQKKYKTRAEITDKFTGVTVTDTFNEGMWDNLDENKRYENTTKTLYVDINPTLKNLIFLVDYRNKLEDRFKQEVIYMNLLPVLNI